MISKMTGAVRIASAYREPNASFVVSKDRHSQVNAETVAKRFRCWIETAWNLPKVNPMESKSIANIAAALSEFIDDVGVPDTLICDLAPEQTGKQTGVMKLIRRRNIKTRNAEKGRGITQNQRTETEIREAKAKWKACMQSSQVPPRLGDCCLVYIAKIQCLLAHGIDQRPGIEFLTGNTVDISEWLDFDFYERVWYWDQKKMDMTDEQARLGCWLGISHRVGRDMTYWILTESGTVITRSSTVQHITISDMATSRFGTGRDNGAVQSTRAGESWQPTLL